MAAWIPCSPPSKTSAPGSARTSRQCGRSRTTAPPGRQPAGQLSFQYRKKTGEGLRFTYVSSGALHIHGLTPEEISANPEHLFADVDPLQLPGLLQAIDDSEREQSDFSAEIRVRTPDGGWRWLQIRSRPRLTAPGETTWDGVVADITARRESDALIELQSRRAHAL